MSKRIKYALLGMVVLPLIGRIALLGKVHEDELYRLLIPMLVGGVAGFLIGLANDRLLAESRQLLKSIIDAAPIGIYWKDKELRYLGCNPFVAGYAGKASAEDFIGKDDGQLGWQDQAERYRVEDHQIMDTGVPKLFCEEKQTTPDGKTVWLSVSKLPLNNANNETVGLLGIVHDITEQKKAEEEIRRMAYHDHLTGLPNRALFYDRLQQALAQTYRHKNLMAVLILDLDHFKPINDELGHEWGDKALVEVSRRLLQCTRATDTVARLGGDEFGLILVDFNSEDVPCKMAEKVIAAIEQSLLLNGSQFTLGVSIGICMASADDHDIESIVSKADTAMYQAKRSGRNCFRISDNTLPPIEHLQ